jgi:uncharacterized membrane protein
MSAEGGARLSFPAAWKKMPVSHRVMMALFSCYFIGAVIVHLVCWGRHRAFLNVGLTAFAMLSMLALCAWHSVVVKGIRSTVAFFALCVAISWFCEYIGHNKGWFFGNYNYTKTLGPAIGGVPVIITVTWSFIIYSSLMLIDWLLGTRGETRAHSWWGKAAWSSLVAAATATLVCAWDLMVDPVATSGVWWTVGGKDPWWYWMNGGPYLRELPGKPGLGAPGMPMGNFVGWWLAPFFIVFLFYLFFQSPNRVSGTPLSLLPLLVYFYIFLSLVFVALEMNWHADGMNQVALIGTFAMMPVIMVSMLKLVWDYW